MVEGQRGFFLPKKSLVKKLGVLGSSVFEVTSSPWTVFSLSNISSFGTSYVCMEWNSSSPSLLLLIQASSPALSLSSYKANWTPPLTSGTSSDFLAFPFIPFSFSLSGRGFLLFFVKPSLFTNFLLLEDFSTDTLDGLHKCLWDDLEVIIFDDLELMPCMFADIITVELCIEGYRGDR